MKNPNIRRLVLTLFAIATGGQLCAQTLSNLGGVAPTPGASDISQLSTQGNMANPDGLNYYTDNYTSWGNGEPGQTFTTGANAGGYVLTSLALRTGGIGSSSGTTTPQPYYLHIYSISGSTATLLQTYTSGNVAFNDGDWLKWTGLSVPLSPNTTYAYSFGKASSTSSYEPLAVCSANAYSGGEIALIKPNTGGISYGGTHTFDAVFDVGLALATTPSVGAVTISPWTNVPAGVPMTFTASAVGALPLTNQWQFDNGGGFVNVSGANTNPLSFVSAVTNIGSYRLVLANSYGAVTSAPVAFAVSARFTNIPASMPFPLPTYGFNIGNKLELSWGAPNPAVLYAAAYNGFNAVRIPCAWDHNATTNVSGGVTNYPINPSYMAQVKQTVDAAVAAGMYVMINDHEDWLGANITTNIQPIIDAKMNSYWSQIATAFAGYDNHLLFAGANEPDSHSDPAQLAVLMHYFQTFVNAVRSTGGNNTNRWLVLQPMVDPTWVTALPTDTVSNRLMLEFHNYTPSLFSIIHSDQSWGTAIYYWGAAYHYSGETNRNATWGEEYDHDAGYQQLADLFVSKGIPVMIGEYGASPTANASATNWNKASVLYWDKYLSESARVHGLSPFYWSTGGDPFDYDTAALKRPDIIAAMTGGTVPPPPNGAPYAASGLTATGGTNRITLSWTAGSGATSYNLYRATTSGGGSKTNPVVTGITGTSYTNTGLANGTTYYYQVVAVNASGISGYSPETKATTYADPSIPILVNLAGAAPVPGPNDISQLSTAGSQTSPDGLNYYTDNGSPAGQTFTTPAQALNLVSVAIKTAGLNNGNGYGTPASTPTLYLRIYSMSGNTATLLKTFSAPNPGYTDGAWLRWSNISVALSPSQTYAYSFGNKPDAGGWAALSVASANTYTGGEIALIPISGGGITTGGSHSFDATFVLGLMSSSTPPATPANLAATAGDAQVGLTWSAAVGAASYNVKRATVNGGPYTTIANVATTGFTDTGLANGTTYYYVVSAVNAVGESANSAQASATPTAPLPPSAPTGLITMGGNAQVGLIWNSSSGATSYNVKRATVNGGPYTTVANVATTSFTDTGLANGTTYYYVVSAVNGGGESGNSAQANATPQVPAPSVPGGLTATGGDAQVALTWNPSSGAASYNVKRATTSGGPYATIASVGTTGYTDTGVVNDTAYYYVVSAVNAGGESANSAQASATPSAPSSLPSPWVTEDIGVVGATGNASYSSGTYSVTGSGADIWNTADEFRFVYQPASSTCQMDARVASIQNTDPSAKAGVMIRESTAAGSRYAAVFITPGNGVTFQWRSSTGGSSSQAQVTGVTAPRYVRIQRASGNSFRAYYSSNGTSWTQIGSNQKISMATSTIMGLAVTSHNDGTLCTSTFDTVTATP